MEGADPVGIHADFCNDTSPRCIAMYAILRFPKLFELPGVDPMDPAAAWIFEGKTDVTV